jgi:hypothetical protein
MSIKFEAPGRTVGVYTCEDGSCRMEIEVFLPASVMKAALEYAGLEDRARLAEAGPGPGGEARHLRLVANQAERRLWMVCEINECRPDDAERAAWVIFNTQAKEEK